MRSLIVFTVIVLIVAACGGSSTSPGDLLLKVDTVVVAPDTATIRIGGSTTLTATPKNSAGATVSAGAAVWSSDNASVASVNSGGVVSGIAPGQATISATISGVSGSARVRVAASAAAGRSSWVARRGSLDPRP